MDRRQVSGYLLIFALVAVVALIFVSAFKMEDESKQELTKEPPNVVDPIDKQQKHHHDDSRRNQMPWQGIM